MTATVISRRRATPVATFDFMLFPPSLDLPRFLDDRDSGHGLLLPDPDVEPGKLTRCGTQLA
jgi:hypothetical protein